MKKNNNHSFKVGDTVYTYHNASWGMNPMKVMELTEDGIRCKHPDFSGIGWFNAKECRLATVTRRLELTELQRRMDALDLLKNSLFKA